MKMLLEYVGEKENDLKYFQVLMPIQGKGNKVRTFELQSNSCMC